MDPFGNFGEAYGLRRMLLSASNETQGVIKDTDYVNICTLTKISFEIMIYGRVGASLLTH